MKRISFIIALILVLSAAACKGKKAEPNSAEPSLNTQTITSSLGLSESQSSAVNPAEAYGKYIESKGKAYDRISEKISENEGYAFLVGMALIPVATVDLFLLPLTVIGMGSGSEIALGMLGMQGVKIDQKGTDFTITYNDRDGNSMVQTCEYDPASDSMRSVINENDREILFFEYVKTGNGYASQYTTFNKDNNDIKLIKSFFDDSNIVGFGFESTSGRPNSIYKNKNLGSQFVINNEMYFMLEDGQLKVMENGKEKEADNPLSLFGSLMGGDMDFQKILDSLETDN